MPNDIEPHRPPPSEPLPLHCLGFKPIGNGEGPLIGTADFHVQRWNGELRGCCIFRSADGRISVAPPVRPMIGAGGLEFDSADIQRLFSDPAVEALHGYAPELFR